MSSSTSILALLLIYVLAGVVTGVALKGRGQPVSVASTAVFAWPLLLGLFESGGAPGLLPGPFFARIQDTFTALTSAMRDPAAEGLANAAELATLRASLLTVDARIGMVDRLLDDEGLRGDPLGERLRDARGHAAAEVEAVLKGVVQLKLQVGLLALVGDTLPVRERMRELGARVRALEEISLS
jgi:hypothetical protein